MEFVVFSIGFFMGAFAITLVVKYKQKKALEQLNFEQRRVKKPFIDVSSEEVVSDD